MADKKETKRALSCTDCGVFNCRDKNAAYPSFCPTSPLSDEEKQELSAMYGADTPDGRIDMSAARIEGRFYCQKNRVEETVLFIKEAGIHKVGIAACIGLINEAKTLAKILQKNDIEYTAVVCKVGGVDKRDMGLAEEDKILKNQDETMCNPMLQARILNRADTGLNISIGLCVGHDALFSKYSKAPVTTLIAKDRMLGHNSVVALYSRYYRRLYE